MPCRSVNNHTDLKNSQRESPLRPSLPHPASEDAGASLHRKPHRQILFGIPGHLLPLLVLWLLCACAPSRLVRICDVPDGEYYFGTPSSYVDAKGDTVVSIGRYLHCYADTIRRMGVVAQHSAQRTNAHDVLIAIDAKGRKLFNVYRFDNGPDYPCDGLFRITDQKGRIGYADTTGRVVIRPRFQAAHYFSDGKAQVARKATLKHDGEYTVWESDEWFTIDTRGRRIASE